MSEKSPLTLLSLPYDVRFLIYQHLFPSSPQIYLQALPDHTITAILAEDTVAANILHTCRAIHSEAAGYLYNTYLFNVIGRKEDCLHSHKTFLQTLRKHAREEVHINAFSNGTHSDTMCISLHTGHGKMGIMRRRGRGVEITLSEISKEVRAQRSHGEEWIAGVVAICIASVLVVLLGHLAQKLVSACNNNMTP